MLNMLIRTSGPPPLDRPNGVPEVPAIFRTVVWGTEIVGFRL